MREFILVLAIIGGLVIVGKAQTQIAQPDDAAASAICPDNTMACYRYMDDPSRPGGDMTFSCIPVGRVGL